MTTHTSKPITRLDADVADLRLLNAAEVARILGCHPVTVMRYAKRGDLKCVRLGSTGPTARVRFTRDEVQRFIAAGLDPVT